MLDPCGLLIAGNLALIHLSIWWFRRRPGPIIASRIWDPLLVYFFCSLCCGLPIYLLGLRGFPLVMLTTPFCGALFAMRQSHRGDRIGLAVLGVVGIGLNAYFVAIIGETRDLTSVSYAEQFHNRDGQFAFNLYTDLFGIAQDETNPKFVRGKLPAGYLDDPATQKRLPFPMGPFERSEPSPLWHTPLTGIYQRHRITARMWIPAGTLVEGLKHAVLVAGDGRRWPVSSWNYQFVE